MEKKDLKHGQIINDSYTDWFVEKDEDGDFTIWPINNNQIQHRNGYCINYDNPITIGYIGNFKLNLGGKPE